MKILGTIDPQEIQSKWQCCTTPYSLVWKCKIKNLKILKWIISVDNEVNKLKHSYIAGYTSNLV